MITELPPEVTETKNILILTLEAKQASLSTHTTIILEVKSTDDNDLPVFEKTYYTGFYGEETGLQFDQLISLQNDISEQVTFSLEGGK